VYVIDAGDEARSTLRRALPKALATCGFQSYDHAHAWFDNLRRKDTDPDGEVYLIQHGDYVKIGFSRDIVRRMEYMQPGAPHKYELIARFPGSVKLEKAIHRRLEKSRHRSEWFFYSDEVAEFIQLVHSKVRLAANA